MKAYVDANYDSRDRDYKNLQRGRPVQERRAKELHRLAGVPEGPCGIPELKKFQAVLPHHRIKVISLAPPHQVIFDGAPFENLIVQVARPDLQRLVVFSTVSSLQFPGHLWHHGTV